MTRILFVDDEQAVLDGLRRMLRPMRKEWVMQFVADGETALDTLDRERFDVIVSDMRMPGMSGVELLAQVKDRHPEMIRLVLSGHTDRGDTMQAVGLAHQYLAKPCDPDMVRGVVTRAAALRSSVHNDRVAGVVASMSVLPSMPSLYAEVASELNSEDPSLAKVAKVIARDPGMAAKVTQLVNSSFFGLRREITSPEQAVTLLGLDTVMALVLSLHLFQTLSAAKSAGVSTEALWSSGMKVATLARDIARKEGLDKERVDDAYLAGLLHDCGLLVIAANFPQETVQIRDKVALGSSVLAAELEVLGATHPEVGGYLLAVWGLPDTLVEAVALHHEPSTAASREMGPLAVVHGAAAIVDELTDHKAGIVLDEGYLAELGALPRIAQWREMMPSPEGSSS